MSAQPSASPASNSTTRLGVADVRPGRSLGLLSIAHAVNHAQAVVLPLIVGVYLGGAIGFVVFVVAGPSLVGLWVGIALMGLFSFAEGPQLQALLADIARPSIRDATFAVYYTLAFGVGSLWVAIYGAIISTVGTSTGLPIVFGLMAVAFVLAALGTLPIRAEQRARENAAYEASLGGP
jgi:MFS family permease